jgi:hypothetical protein
MNGTLLVLTGVMLGAIALNGVAADPGVPLGQELHAAVTNMPDVIDMSHAVKPGMGCRAAAVRFTQ